MKITALIITLMALTALLLSTAQSRQEPLKLGRRLSQTDDSAAATAAGTGDSVSTSAGTSGSNGQTTIAMPTTTTAAVDGSAAGSATATAGTVTATPPIVPRSWSTVCNVRPWICKFPPKMPPPPHTTPPPPHMPPPPPHMPPSPHRPPIIKIPIFRHKEVKVIIVPPKPVPEIPICKGKIKEACCDSKDYCPWNWWYYPDKEPPKVCKVEVEVIKELKLCQWPVLVWKDEFDFTCKCPETPKPCDACNVCYEDSTSSSARAYASSSDGYGGGGGGGGYGR